ncbi:MAG TPA: FAD-binding oxidoreductase [Herpetosiphonaceae bacterium]
MSSMEAVFPGSQVVPDDPRYATLVRGFNQRFVGQPSYVQVCGDTTQLVQAVQRAVDADLRITVRGGGHCYEGFVSCNDGGVILDLSPLNAVYYDSTADRFCIEGGCTLWNVYSQLYKEYGRTLPGGSCYSVGAGGHIIGGGYGLLSRKYGLIVDHLQAVEVVYVTRDRVAKVIEVRADSPTAEERDLFWAHQGGGGGNFGIVTKYWFKDPPQAPSAAYLASVAWDWDSMTYEAFVELVRSYGSFLQKNSDPGRPYQDLFTLLHLTRKEASQIVLTIQTVSDQPDLLQSAIAEIAPRSLTLSPQRVPVGYHHYVPHVSLNESGTASGRWMPWLEATQTLNPSGPNQRGKYKSAYMIQPFPQQQIDTIWHFLTESSYHNPQALLQVDSYGCQINTVAPDATPVPQRSSIMKLQYQTYWTDPDQDQEHLRWIRDFYTAMYGPKGPYPDAVMDGCYVNYPDVDLEDWPYLYYKDNYPRLQRTKARWDALNIFHHQQSIRLPDEPAP